MTNAAWTDERTEQCTSLWTEGLSASQIARVLGNTTRNSVIGKVHRLGLAGRGTPARVERPRLPRAPRKGARGFLPGTSKIKTGDDVLVFIAHLDTNHEGTPLEHLELGQCHTPKGSDADGETLYCGKATGSRRHNYCDECNRNLHQQTSASRQQNKTPATQPAF